MKTARAIKNQPANLNEIATKFLLVKMEIEAMEKLLSGYRSTLEAAAQANQGVLELPEYRVSVSECERENFALKTARQAIPSEVLQPYISVSKYNRVSVSKRGGKVAA